MRSSVISFSTHGPALAREKFIKVRQLVLEDPSRSASNCDVLFVVNVLGNGELIASLLVQPWLLLLCLSSYVSCPLCSGPHVNCSLSVRLSVNAVARAVHTPAGPEKYELRAYCLGLDTKILLVCALCRVRPFPIYSARWLARIEPLVQATVMAHNCSVCVPSISRVVHKLQFLAT